MTDSIPPCPECSGTYAYESGELLACPECGHEWNPSEAADDVLATWRSTLADSAWVMSREEAIAAGWFGHRVRDDVRVRIGDVVAAARGSAALLRRTAEPMESALIGQHGSLTSAEQYVPLLAATN